MTPFGLVVIMMGVLAFLPLAWYGVVELCRVIKQYLKVRSVNNYEYF